MEDEQCDDCHYRGEAKFEGTSSIPNRPANKPPLSRTQEIAKNIADAKRAIASRGYNLKDKELGKIETLAKSLLTSKFRKWVDYGYSKAK